MFILKILLTLYPGRQLLESIVLSQTNKRGSVSGHSQIITVK